MMKKLLYSSLLLLAIFAMHSCRPDEATKGLDSFQLTLNTDIFNYRIKLNIVDENGQPIPNAELSIDGRDADIIFTEVGSRDYFVGSNGAITLTLNPYKEPSAGQTAEFSAIVSAAGYIPGAVDMVIESGDFEPTYRIELLPENGSTKYGDIETYSLSLNNGAVSSSGIYNKSGKSVLRVVGKNANIDTIYYDDELNSIIIPQGMTFTYWEKVVTQGVQVTPRYAPVPSSFMDSVQVNGQWVYLNSTNLNEIVGYDTTEYDVVNWIRRNYTGNSLKVRTFYFEPSNFNPTRIIRGSESSRTVRTISKEDVPVKRAVLEPAAEKLLSWVFYEGKIDGKPVSLQPVQTKSKQITYSIQINPNFVHPVTNQPIAAGDSLEGDMYRTGPESWGTVKMQVVQAPNGQLRVQSSSYKAGIYRWLRFDFDYDYSVSIPAISSVPDINNVFYYGLIDLGNGFAADGFSFYGRRSAFQRRFFGKLVSTAPISANAGVRLFIGYWNRTIANKFFPGSNFNQQLVQESDFESLPPETRYTVEVVCTKNDSTKINPSIDATTNVGGYWQTIRMTNGRWATRGVELNTPIDISIQFREYQFDTLFTVTKAENLIRYFAQTNEDVCNF